MFLSYADHFRGLHPAWPPHYAFLTLRLFRAALQDAALKVRLEVPRAGKKPAASEGNRSRQRNEATRFFLRPTGQVQGAIARLQHLFATLLALQRKSNACLPAPQLLLK